MIIQNEPLSMAEALEYAKKAEENKPEVITFIKNFSKMKAGEAQDMKKELSGLGLIKIRPEHISKIIDILPENSEELNKIFVDISLDEDETNKILDTIKKYK